MKISAPRILLGGTASGCGKKTAVLALLKLLLRRGRKVSAFKCGPDYIDPMFHAEIVGADAGNLDAFLTPGKVRDLFAAHAGELSVIEGVMGYYDGGEGSAYRTAQILRAPAVLLIDGKGTLDSAVAVAKGFLAYRPDNRIAGVIFNRVTARSYAKLAALLRQETGLSAFGYLPALPGECRFESRHLGLVTAAEVEGLRQRLERLADFAEQTLDVDGLISVAEGAGELQADSLPAARKADFRVAVARDRAFCFYYRENLECLQRHGAELVFFSPLADRALPEGISGVYLGGGYPELYAKQLEENSSMRDSVRKAVISGMPCIAECGGFLYLSRQLDGHDMAGVLPGLAENRGRLVRFGYVELEAKEDNLLLRRGERCRGHEFHYYDSTDNGKDCLARHGEDGPYACIHAGKTCFAGFPHLHFESRPEMAERFRNACLKYSGRTDHETDGH